MGKTDITRFTTAECRDILDTIQNDLDIRLKENNNLSKIQEDVVHLVSQRNILASQKEFNSNYCILCQAPFNLLFKRKILCLDCGFLTCKPCSSWDIVLKQWLCKVCEKQRILDTESRVWICNRLKSSFGHFRAAKALQGFCRKRRISDSENDSGYGPTSDVGPLLKFLSSHSLNSDLKMADSTYDCEEEEDDMADEEELAEIHHSIETILEGLLGGTLDDAAVDQMFPGVPLYEKLFASFHGQLVEAIRDLSKALQKALHNLPIENGITPTTAHTALKGVIAALVEECQDFPCLQIPDENGMESINANSSFEYCDVFQSYDSLVASAVINKVVEECQSRFIKQFNTVTEENDSDIHQDTTVVSKDQQKEQSEPDDDYADITVETLTPTEVSAFGFPIESVKIEEEVEEITREFTDSEEDKLSSVSHWSSSLQSLDGSQVPKNPDLDPFIQMQMQDEMRTPFPEFGCDLVEDADSVDFDVTCHLTSTMTWEENWLFRKRKRLPLYSNLKYQLLTYCDEPPCMLIPCPTESTDAIDSQDDLSSELSEPHSVASLASSSDPEESNMEATISIERIPSKSLIKKLDTTSPVTLTKLLPIVKPQSNVCHAKDSSETQNDALDIKIKTSAQHTTISSERESIVSPLTLETNFVGTPPRPGTIAEREHQKWLNAVPLKHNPYSAENISKRSSLPPKPISKEPATSFEEFERKHSISSVTSEQAAQIKLDCGLKSIDGDLYKRDYYINNVYANGDEENFALEKSPAQFESFVDDCFETLSEEALNSFEEKVYVSSGKVFTLENHVKRLERELKDSSFSSETSPVPPIVNNCPVKIENKAQQNPKPQMHQKQEGEKIKKCRPCMKVHSLTARSLSREFRDLAKLNLPKPMNRTIQVQQSSAQSNDETSERDSLCSPDSTPSLGGSGVPPDHGHGYTSDESSTSTNSIPPRNRARRHISRSILQRASYWERRVEQGLLSDASVNEEFPGVDISPE